MKNGPRNQRHFIGGSSLLALISLLTGREIGVLAALAAGAIVAGYVAVEAATLKQVPHGPSPTEYLYFGLGVAICGLASFLWLTEDRRHRFQPKVTSERVLR